MSKFAINVTFDSNGIFIPCLEPFRTSGCIQRIKLRKSNLSKQIRNTSHTKKEKIKHICFKKLFHFLCSTSRGLLVGKRVLLTKNFHKYSFTLKLRINRPKLTRRRFLFLCVKFLVLVACRQTKHLNHNIQIYIFLL